MFNKLNNIIFVKYLKSFNKNINELIEFNNNYLIILFNYLNLSTKCKVDSF